MWKKYATLAVIIFVVYFAWRKFGGTVKSTITGIVS